MVGKSRCREEDRDVSRGNRDVAKRQGWSRRIAKIVGSLEGGGG